MSSCELRIRWLPCLALRFPSHSLRLRHQEAATRHDVLKSLYLLWSARDCFSCCNSWELFFFFFYVQGTKTCFLPEWSALQVPQWKEPLWEKELCAPLLPQLGAEQRGLVFWHGDRSVAECAGHGHHWASHMCTGAASQDWASSFNRQHTPKAGTWSLICAGTNPCLGIGSKPRHSEMFQQPFPGNYVCTLLQDGVLVWERDDQQLGQLCVATSLFLCRVRTATGCWGSALGPLSCAGWEWLTELSGLSTDSRFCIGLLGEVGVLVVRRVCKVWP